MSDIVERLRLLAAVDNCQASLEAADEITRLRAEVEKLREEIKHSRQEHAILVETLDAEIERLRGQVEFEKKCRNDAFDELKKQDAEIERLRAALREIIADSFSVYAIEVARAALDGK